MAHDLRIGVLYSRVRVEEKWIFAAMEQQRVDYERLDDRQISFDLANPGFWRRFDAVLERSISYARGLYALKTLNAWGVKTVNTAAVAEACGDKIATANALSAANVPQPATAIQRNKDKITAEYRIIPLSPTQRDLPKRNYTPPIRDDQTTAIDPESESPTNEACRMSGTETRPDAHGPARQETRVSGTDRGAPVRLPRPMPTTPRRRSGRSQRIPVATRARAWWMCGPYSAAPAVWRR